MLNIFPFSLDFSQDFVYNTHIASLKERIIPLKQIFIDGSAGTTGLRIRERLALRSDITLITLPEELRKDPEARRDALSRADVAFLCLPDGAAMEAVALAEGTNTVLIDTDICDIESHLLERLACMKHGMMLNLCCYDMSSSLCLHPHGSALYSPVIRLRAA